MQKYLYKHSEDGIIVLWDIFDSCRRLRGHSVSFLRKKYHSDLLTKRFLWGASPPQSSTRSERFRAPLIRFNCTDSILLPVLPHFCSGSGTAFLLCSIIAAESVAMETVRKKKGTLLFSLTPSPLSLAGSDSEYQYRHHLYSSTARFPPPISWPQASQPQATRVKPITTKLK